MKRFECSPLGKELKGETHISKKQYQKLDIDYKFDEESKVGKYNKSDLIYKAIPNDIKKFNKLSIESKKSFLSCFSSDLNRFSSINPRNENTIYRKTKMYHTALELYAEFLDIYFDKYYDLPNAKKRRDGL